MSSIHVTRALEVGRQTLLAAGKVHNSLFPNWRQRAFRRHLGRFIVALQEIPQTEAGVLTSQDIAHVSTIVDQLVTEADAFISARYDATTAEVGEDELGWSQGAAAAANGPLGVVEIQLGRHADQVH